MTRPTVRKINGQWTSMRPGYGFSKDQTRTHRSWKAAIRSFETRSGASTITETTWQQHDEVSCRAE
ncbi:hypothetical protein [Amycolatopsis pigmentata]|uniref:Uncharacterized protein n=1 Tax=Amycolatopsis pigmentata TaxID=450801 RepID=A0ABW5G2Y9_9PSEU